MNRGPAWVIGPWSGRLAILPRPRGGDWLQDEVDAWAQSGLSVIVSLLSPEETAEFDLATESGACRAHGLDFVSFPVPDRGVPSSREGMLRLVRTLEERLSAGKSVGIHCRQGIGRSPLAAACVLVASGIVSGVAFERLTHARGRPVPETTEQREWVEAFARQLVAPA